MVVRLHARCRFTQIVLGPANRMDVVEAAAPTEHHGRHGLNLPSVVWQLYAFVLLL